MSELYLRFAGLCAFVPRQDINPKKTDNRARVLLVDARMAHEPHVPVLIVRDGLVVINDPSFRKPDGNFLIGTTRYHYFELDDEDVSIEKADDKSLKIEVGEGTDCPVSAYSSFEWVVPVQDISPGYGDVKDNCLESGGHVSVVARVVLTEGTLTTHELAKEIDSNEVLLWEFKPAAGGNPVGREQAIAEVVQLTYSFSENYCDLQTLRFRMPANSRTIRLLTTDIGGLKAFAGIVNMPWDNIMRTKVFLPPREADYHFVHFYDLSSKAGGGNIPWPLDSCGPEGPSSDTPLCPPARFNFHQLA